MTPFPCRCGAPLADSDRMAEGVYLCKACGGIHRPQEAPAVAPRQPRRRFGLVLLILAGIAAAYFLLRPSAADRVLKAAGEWDAEAFRREAREVQGDPDVQARLEALLTRECDGVVQRIDAHRKEGRPDDAARLWNGLNAVVQFTFMGPRSATPVAADMRRRTETSGARVFHALSIHASRPRDVLAHHMRARGYWHTTGADDREPHAQLAQALRQRLSGTPEAVESILEMILTHEGGVCAAGLGDTLVDECLAALEPFDRTSIVVVTVGGPRVAEAVASRCAIQSPYHLRPFKGMPGSMTPARERQCAAVVRIEVAKTNATYGGDAFLGFGGFQVPESAALTVSAAGLLPNPWPREEWATQIELPEKLMGQSDPTILSGKLASPTNETQKLIEKYDDELDAKIAAYVRTWDAWTVP